MKEKKHVRMMTVVTTKTVVADDVKVTKVRVTGAVRK